MLQRLSDPQSVFLWWLAIGLLLGLYFAQLLNSFTIGVPMGVAFVLVLAKATTRISSKLSR